VRDALHRIDADAIRRGEDAGCAVLDLCPWKNSETEAPAHAQDLNR
jgi:hypothetical protein